MKVTKDQIINGVISFVEAEVVPQVGDKAMQILVSIYINAAKENTALLDSLFENPLVAGLLKADEDGYFEMDSVCRYAADALKKYGPFPVEIPAIPFVSPSIKTLSFNESDVFAIKKRIERSN